MSCLSTQTFTLGLGCLFELMLRMCVFYIIERLMAKRRPLGVTSRRNAYIERVFYIFVKANMFWKTQNDKLFQGIYIHTTYSTKTSTSALLSFVLLLHNSFACHPSVALTTKIFVCLATPSITLKGNPPLSGMHQTTEPDSGVHSKRVINAFTHTEVHHFINSMKISSRKSIKSQQHSQVLIMLCNIVCHVLSRFIYVMNAF